MLLSKSWLADFIKLDISTDNICKKLTSLGLEVEGVSKVAPNFKGVVIGKVTELEKHPDADKLKVAKVDIGEDSKLQIVCGATNIYVDMVAPVAKIGAVLPKNFKIKKTKLRGVESFGMLCSSSEIGLSDESSGLMDLSALNIEIGTDIREALDLNDEVIEIGLTPNRGDCFSILGVARELSVAFEEKLQYLETKDIEEEGMSPNVRVLEENSCPSYIARKITGVNNSATSPLWLVERLRRAGVRSLSPVVDVTNYVMLELGTPMHAFSSDAISGDITVRFANENENITLLDDKKIELDEDMLVIADDNKSIALAGIMGGKDSAVDSSTNDIILESAWFSPSVITGRARRISLHTDSSQRFERGVDYLLQAKAMDYASQLIVDICGGKTHKSSMAINESLLPNRKSICLSSKNTDAVLGFKFPKKEIVKILTSLGMTVADSGNNIYDVIPPSYRFDINIEEDLIEELSRVWGYDKVPVANVSVKKIKNQAKHSLTPRIILNNLLVNMGYHEAITYSFIDKEIANLLSDDKNLIELINPISSDMSVMRTSLVPSLIKSLVYNKNRQENNIRLYEIGNVYNKVDGKIIHTEKLSGIATGENYPMQWGFKNREIDFFDIKGDIEQIFEYFGILPDITYARSEKEYLHPGQSADIFYKDELLGFVGAINPKLQKILSIDTRILAFELDTAKISHDTLPNIQSVPKYPKIRRDISILIAQGYQAEDITKIIINCSDIIADVKLFDVYIGRNIPKNTKSMAIAIYMQDKTKTLTDNQADEVIDNITKTIIKQFNAELRG